MGALLPMAVEPKCAADPRPQQRSQHHRHVAICVRCDGRECCKYLQESSRPGTRQRRDEDRALCRNASKLRGKSNILQIRSEELQARHSEKEPVHQAVKSGILQVRFRRATTMMKLRENNTTVATNQTHRRKR